MSFERAGGSSSCVVDQNRSLNFHESFSVKEMTYTGDYCGTLPEHFLRLRVSDQVQISLSVYRIGIGKAVKLLRKRPEGFAQQYQFRCMDGDLSGLGTENIPFDSEYIAYIPFLETGIGLFPDVVPAGIYLYSPGRILQVEERSLPHDPSGHNSSRYRYGFLRSIIAETFSDILRIVSHIIGRDKEWIIAFLSHRSQFFFPDSDLLILIHFLLCRSVHSVLCHK